MKDFLDFILNNYVVIISILVGILLLLVALLFRKKEKFPYIKKALLSDSEKTFYYELYKYACKNNCLVFTKVRLADFCSVDKKQIKKDKYMKYFAKIRAKHIDFLLCDSMLNVIMAIELDDKSHNYQSARENDEFKNKLYETIAIKLVRVKTSKTYDIEELLNH